MADEILAGGEAVQTGEKSFAVDGSQSGELNLPDHLSVADADFSFDGGDLVLTFPDGTTVTVEGYADNPNPPTLVSADGAEVGSDVISALADAGAASGDAPAGGGEGFGFIQPEQAEAIQAAEASGNLADNPNLISGTDGEPIGNIESLQGEVYAIRVDGTRERLELGDQVFQGDILESGPQGNVGVLLADETTFAMGPEGRMVLDEMVYDPGTQEGSVSMSVLQGVFTFVSGQVAKTDPDAMTLDTPVATIGIRGTQVGIDIRDGENMNVHLMEERFGFVGEVVVVNDAGVQVLNDANAFTRVASFDTAPSPFEIVSVEDILASYQQETLRYLPTRNSDGERTSGNTYEQGNEVEGENRESVDFLNDFQTDAGGPQEPQAPAGPIRVTGALQNLNIIDQARGELNDVNVFITDKPKETVEIQQQGPVVEKPDEVITADEIEETIPADLQVLINQGTLKNVNVSEDGNTVTADVTGDFDATGLDYTFVLTGDDTQNVITTGDGDDTLSGTGADDIINGGAGDDTLIASPGGGDDTYIGGDGNDTITFAASDDDLTINLEVGAASDDEGDNGIGQDTIIDIENVIGGSGNDIIIGDDNANILRGGGGDDFIDGRGGQDTAAFSGSYGQSTISIVNGVLTVTGPDGTDTIESVENFAFDESPNLVVGLEDTAISLNLADHVPAAENATSIVIRGVPDGGELSAGTQLEDGSWLLNSGDLEGLTVTGAANSAQDFSLNISAYNADYLSEVTQAAADYLEDQLDPVTNEPLQTLEDFLAEGGSALELVNGPAGSYMPNAAGTGAVGIEVIGGVDPFSITIDGVEMTADGTATSITFAGTEDQEVPLNIAASLTDTDGSEVVSVTVSGLPTLEVQQVVSQVPVLDEDGEPLLDDDGEPLFDEVTSWEPVTDAAGNPVGAHLVYEDADGNDVILPPNETGTYELSAAQLNNLRLVGSPDDSDDINLEFSAQVRDGEATETVFGSATVELVAKADVPSVNGSAEIGIEDQPVSINFDIDKNDVSEHITDVTLTGIPEGSKLAIEYTDPDSGEKSMVSIPVVNGAASIPLGFLGEDMSTENLQLTPPAHLSGVFDLQLNVTSTEPTNGDTAVNNFNLPLEITAVADELGVTVNGNQVLDGDTVSVNALEDGAFGLDISAMTEDTDGSEVISITISGVPNGALLSAGTDNGDGTWTLSPEDADGLSITPPLNSDVDFDLGVTVTNVDNNQDVTTLEANVSVGLEAVADAANLAVDSSIEGVEDFLIPIGESIDASLADTDGSESLSITIAGLPEGSTLSAGTDNGDGSWTVTPAQLSGLTMTPALHISGAFDLTVTATTTEAANGDTAVVSQQIGLNILPDPDAPEVNVTSVLGNEDLAIPLNIGAELVDTDGSETLSVSISGVPNGALLSAGTQVSEGVWEVDPADLAELKITPPADSNEDFNLTVTATATESNGEFAETVVDVPVSVLGVADAPELVTDTVTALEGTDIPLNIGAQLGDTDGSESLSITIDNIPNGAFLLVPATDESGVPLLDDLGETIYNTLEVVDQSATLSPSELEGLVIRPPAGSDEDFDLLVTATATENDNDISANGQGVASVSGTLSVVVHEVADPPSLMLFDSLGNEDTPVPLNIAAILTDADETLSVTVSGVPEGVTLSKGTLNDDGTWNLTAEDLPGLTMTTPENFSGEFSINVDATSTTDDGTFATQSGSLNVAVRGVADAPDLDLVDLSADEGSLIPLNIGIAAGLVDTDGSETLSINIGNLPEGAQLFSGVTDLTDTDALSNLVPLDIVDGAVELTAEQLEGLVMLPPPGLDEDFTLQVTATATEADAALTGNNQGVASVSGVINVDMTAIADVPSLILQNAAGNEDSAIPLDIGATIQDTSETLSITIGNVPAGAVLSAGSNNNDGTWTLTPDQLEGLTITPPEDSNEDFQLEITATSTEQDGTTASSTAALSVAVTGVADEPALEMGDADGLEDLLVPLNISANLADTDGSESLSVTISGLPDGASLTAGVRNQDGSWTLSGEELDGLGLVPSPDLSGNFSLMVTATSTENDGDSSSVTGLMNINLSAVADAPSLLLHDAAGFEDDAIPLEISTEATGGDEIVGITITGVPNGATLSAGTNNGNGTWTLTQEQLEGLTVTPPENSNTNFQLGVTVTSMDDDDLAETTQAMNVSVTGVADKPTLNVPSQITIDGALESADLGIESALTDMDGSESLSVSISNIPTGAVVKLGNSVLDVVGGTVDGILPNQLAGLQITPPPGFDGNFTLQVTATATETDPDNVIPEGLETSVSIGYIDVTVDGVIPDIPDIPDLELENALGYEDNAIPLDIDAALTDPSETLSLTISGVPEGATLSAGTDLGNGTWSLLPEEAEGLTITAPEDSNVDFDLTVTATSTTPDGEIATTTGTIGVDVVGVADSPNLAASVGAGEVIGGGMPDIPAFDNAISNVVMYLDDGNGNVEKVRVESFPDGGDSINDVNDMDLLGFVADNYPGMELTAVTVKAGNNGGPLVGPGEGQLFLIDPGTVANELPLLDHVDETLYFNSSLEGYPGGGSTGDGVTVFPLDISSSLNDLDGSETLSITISDLPAGVTLSAGEQADDGTWVLSEQGLDGLTMSVPLNVDPDFDFDVTATATENDGDTASVSTTVGIDGDNAAEAPELEVGAAEGDEDADIPLDISAALTDTDGSETLSVKISGVPNEAELSAGTDNQDGSWTLTPEQLAGLTIRPPQDSDDDFTLTIEATSVEQSTGDTAVVTAALPVVVNAVADAPNVAAGDGDGDVGQTVPLDIQSILNDTDGSESLSINIGGFPEGASLNAGAINDDGSYTLSVQDLDGLAISLPDGASDDFDLTVTATSTEQSNQDQASNVVTAAINVDPLANDDRNVVEIGEVTTGNVLTGAGDSADPSAAADVGSESGNSVVDVSFGGMTKSFNNPDDVQSDADGSYIEIAGDHGTLKMYQDGSYDYAADESEAVSHVAGLTGTANSGAVEEAWSGVQTFAFDFGTSYVNENGQFDPTLANGQVTFTSDGIGVAGTQGGMPVPDQINHDNNTGESQALGINLGGSTSSATLTVSRLFNNEDGGEQGVWQAYDADGNLVGEGSLNSSTVDYSGSNNTGTAEISLPDGGSFQYLVFTATDTGNDQNQNDSSDFFVRALQYETDAAEGGEDAFTYTMQDTDGDTASATLTIDVSEEQDTTASDPTLDTTDAAGLEDNDIPLDIAAGLGDLDGSETLSISIAGVPDEASLSAGIKNDDGTWSVSPEDLAGLSVRPPLHSNEDFQLTVTATSIEANGGDTATTTATIDVDVTGVADAPPLSVSIGEPELTAGGDPIETTIDANNVTDGGLGFTVTGRSINQDGSLTDASADNISLHGNPVGFGVGGQASGDDSEVGFDYHEGISEQIIVDFDSPASSADVSFAWLHNSEQASYELFRDGVKVGEGIVTGITDQIDPPVTFTAQDGGTFDQIVFAAPGSGDDYLINSISFEQPGNEALAEYPLNISTELVDADGSETLSINVAGLPEGAELSAGTQNQDGSWTLTPGQLSGLTMTVAAGVEDFSVDVTATTVENDGDTAFVTASVDVTVPSGDQTAEDPNLNVGDVTGDEDTDIALDIASSLNDTDGSETLSVTIAGVPGDAELSAGIKNGDGTWTLEPGQLEGLTVRPPQNSNEDFQLTVTATSVESASGDTATTTATMNVNVTGVADAPTLTVTVGAPTETPATGTLTITNMGQESAGYNNSYGYYVKDADGNPAEGMVIWDNAKQEVGDTFTLQGVDPDSIGFFVIPNGDNENAGLGDNTAVTFEQDGEGNWHAVGPNGNRLEGAGDPVLFSDPALNEGGFDYTTDNSLAGNQNWEDLFGGGDNDFNDVNINVNYTPGEGSGTAEYPLNIMSELQDTDGSEELSITVSGLPEGASLSAGTVNQDGSVTLTPAQLAGLTMTVALGTEDFQVGVTATTTENDGDSTSVSATVAIDAPDGDITAETPDLTAYDGAGDEDTDIPLDINSSLTDIDGSESLSITIAGVPGDATLSAGSRNDDGTWTLEEGDLDGLTVRPDTHSDTDMELTITATSTESSTGDTASQTVTMNVAVNAVADAPQLTASIGQGTVIEGDSVAGETSTVFSSNFGSSDVGFVQTLDGWSTNSDAIETWDSSSGQTGDGAYIELNDDSSDYFDDATSINREFPTEDGATYTLTFRYSPRPGYDESVNRMDVRVDGQAIETVSANGSGNSDNVWQTQTITFTGNGETMNLEFLSTGAAQTHGRGIRLDDVVLTQTTEEVSGESTIEYPLDITAALTDSDGSESLSINVGNMPEGATLSAGTQNNDGSWTLTAGQLAGLTMTIAAGTEDFDLSVTAVSTETSNNDAASTTTSLFVDVPETGADTSADGVSLNAGNVSGDEDQAIPLDIASSLNDTDGSESLSIMISGMPNGAVLSAGTQNNDGTWTLEAGDLQGLTLTPPENSNEDFTLTVTATGTEAEGGESSSQSTTFDVDVTGVADRASVSASATLAEGHLGGRGSQSGSGHGHSHSGSGSGSGSGWGSRSGSGHDSDLIAFFEVTEDDDGDEIDNQVSRNDGENHHVGFNHDSDGPSGTSAVFDGHYDYIEVDHKDNMEMESGTFVMWFKTDNADSKQALFSKDSTGYDDGGHLTGFVDDGQLEVRLQSGSNSYMVQGGSVNTGAWHQMAFSFGPDGMRLYLDGNLVDSDSYSGGMTGNEEPLLFGANQWGSDDGQTNNLRDFFDGEMDKIAVYDRALTPTEIANMHDAGVSQVVSGDDTLVYDLDIEGSLNDVDGSETLSFQVRGLPDGVTLSAGQSDGNGTWTLGPDDLSGLTMTVGESVSDDFSIEVVAVSTEDDGDTEESRVVSLEIDVAVQDPVEINGTYQSETLEGASGDDSISGNSGHDKLYGFAGDDILNGGSGNDSLFGDIGNDVMDGGTGHDYLSGGAGDDTLTGGSGDDTLDGGAGNDHMFGDSGHEVMLGGDGDDTMQGGDGDDRLYGEDGFDSIDGGSGHDKLYGGEGNDILVGGLGNDTLQGGLGDDTLTGGSGADRFEMDAQSGHDIIQDIMEQDTVVFEGQEFHADDMIFNENEEGDVVVSFKGVEGQSVTLNGVSMDDLDRNGDGDASDGYSVTEEGGKVTLTIDAQ
ncbi:MAG: LamG-like jellyroll fold domain-containing protein [Rhodospirillales bacterium]